MRQARRALLMVMAVAWLSRPAPGQIVRPFTLLDEPDSVYAPPSPPTPEEGVNAGGVNFRMNISYLSDYVYRGIAQNSAGLRTEQALQFDGLLKFNLGRLPHPFVGLFVNVFNTDPISRFEEVRPYAGLEWNLRPLTIAGGYNSYIFPNREHLDTEEIFASIALDDAYVFHTEHALLNPYVYGAYDFHKYNGVYLETGLRHDFVIEDTGLVISPMGDVAFVFHHDRFRKTPTGPHTGFQHYDVGVLLSYSLNQAFNLPHRYGEWKLNGYLTYAGPIGERLRADSKIWGGVGITFSY